MQNDNNDLEINTPKVLAVRLLEEPVLYEGLTKPLKIECFNERLNQLEHYVVKFHNNVTGKGCGIASEIICSHLAHFFDIPTPNIATVEITGGFYESVAIGWNQTDDTLTSLNQNKHDLNFGSKLLEDTTLSPTMLNRLEPEQKALAGRIFSFDALIYNADRSKSKHNLFIHDEKYYIFDHERAFNFLRNPNISTPNNLDFRNPDGSQFLQDHLFRDELIEKDKYISDFVDKLDRLEETELDRIILEVPSKIRDEHGSEIELIKKHIMGVKRDSRDFLFNALRILR